MAVREEEVVGVEGEAAAAAAAEGRGCDRLRKARHPWTAAPLVLADGRLCKKAVAAVLCEVCRGVGGEGWVRGVTMGIPIHASVTQTTFHTSIPSRPFLPVPNSARSSARSRAALRCGACIGRGL